MRRLNKTLTAGVCALVASCATTKQTAQTYWTEKSGVAVVHHVLGNVDSTEKLTEKQLTAKEIETAGLPKGKYFKVVQAQGQVTPAAIPSASPNKVHAATEDSVAELSKQLRALKNQVKTVEAQNQHLQEELDTAASQKTAQQESAQEQSNEPVRMSQ